LIGNNLDPQYANHIKKYVKKKKLSKKIQILPFVDKKELSLIYENSNCFVLSSLQEGAPNVLLESLYFGLPTISTNVGNASAILGKNGILVANSYERLEKLSLQSLVNLSYSVDQKNKKELAIAMCNMIEEYSSWLEKSEDMRKYILSKYSVENMVQSYEDMYQKYIK